MNLVIRTLINSTSEYSRRSIWELLQIREIAQYLKLKVQMLKCQINYTSLVTEVTDDDDAFKASSFENKQALT